jgi:hypothetical protein
VPTLEKVPIHRAFLKRMAGVEGLHGPTKYNGLAESGAVLDPHIICRNLRDCPTDHAERHLVRDEGVAGSDGARPSHDSRWRQLGRN